MAHPVAYVGDAVTAAAFRLAGAATHVPPAGEEAATLERARAEARVVLISAECAGRIPPRTLEAALAAVAPLVLVVPEAGARPTPLDPAGRVRRELGLEP